MTSLKDKAISGVFWSFLQKVGSRGISFFVMILLARLLLPEDFGLIGMLSVFIGLSQVLVNGGFNLALIQKKDTDEEDYSSVFYINLVVSICLYFILYFAAPFIADFYDQPILVNLTRVLSLVFIINAFSYVQEARLTKAIKFKVLMIVHIPSTIFGGIVSVVMAIWGYGVWSIVMMQLITRFAYAVQIWIHAKWRPLLSFNWNKAKSLFSFGGKLMVSGIINSLYSNIYLIIIGKFFPLNVLGYYQNAYNMVNAPSGTLTTVINAVTFPVFSSIQNDDKRLKDGFRKVMQQIFFWICPLFFFAGVLATPLFHFLFSDKWLPAVPYFRLLCIVGVIQPIELYNLYIVNVKGRSDVWLKMQVAKRVIITIAVIVVIPFGIMALLIVQSIGAVFTFFLFSQIAGKYIQYTMREQICDLLPTFLLSVLVGGIILALDSLFSGFSDIMRLFLGFGIGCSLYALLARYFKFSSFFDFKTILKSKLPHRLSVRL